jgi:predicted phosphodiesterase
MVFGNCDWDAADLGDYARHLGVTVDHPAGRLTLDGLTLAFTHGDDPLLMQRAIADRVTYLFHGHTHRTRDETVGSTRVINPGALHRAAQYTVALLDTATGRLEFVPVPED